MKESYTEIIELRTCDCNMEAFWRPGSILEIMQETAAAHCEQLEASHEQLDPLGLGWVLSRTAVEMTRLPRYGERVTVETYLLPVRHLFYPRGNVIRDARGTVIGVANSYWVLMDMNTRRMVNSDYVQEHLPVSGERQEPVRLNAAIRPLEGEIRRGTLAPRYSEFDLNGHVNNTHYMDWCCDALGAELLREKQIADFRVYSENELRMGAGVDTELTVQGDRFAFFGFSEGKRCFSAGGVLKDSSGW